MSNKQGIAKVFRGEKMAINIHPRSDSRLFSYAPAVRPQDIAAYRKEAGSDSKGIKLFFKDYCWTLIPLSVSILATGGIIWWTHRCAKNGKIATQDNASSNRMKEQDNASQNRKNEIQDQSDADILKIREASEAKKSEIRLRGEIRAMKEQKESSWSSESGEEIQSYEEAKANGNLSGNRERCLGFPYFKVGYSRILVGATNVGKTTYMLQEAIAIARGKCEVPLTAKWCSIPPVHVIVFSLEQTDMEIQKFWGAAIEKEPVKSHFHIYCGQVFPKQIVETVNKHLAASNEYGVVLYIDNMGKLEEYASHKDIVKMNRELDHIRQTASRSCHPLTTVKVYHTHTSYDASKPFTLKSVRGNRDNVNLNNDVTFITYTNQGDDKRMVGQLKNKHGQTGIVNIVEFVGNGVEQFRYVGSAKEEDVLVSKDKGEDSEATAVLFNPHTPGPKPTISYEEAQRLQGMVTRGEMTWKQIEAETGDKKSKIKWCLRKHRQSNP